MKLISIVLVLVAFIVAAAASVNGTYCHTSGYDGVDAQAGYAAKKQLYAACKPGPSKVGNPMGSGKGKCSFSIAQTFPSEAAFKAYDNCEHGNSVWKKTFDGKKSTCAGDKNGAC